MDSPPVSFISSAVLRLIPGFLLLAVVGSGTHAAAQQDSFRVLVDSARVLIDADPEAAAALAARAASVAGDDRRHISAEELLAQAYQQAGKHDAALRTYWRAMPMAVRLKDPQLRARLHNGIGTALAALHRYDRALKIHLRAAALFDSLGNDVGKAQALHDVAEVLHALGETAEAWQMHQRALDLRLREEHRPGIAESYNSIGDMYVRRGALDSALTVYQKSLAQQKRLGLLTRPVAESLNDIGSVHLLRNENTRALEYFEEALNVAEEVGDRGLIAAVSRNIGAANRLLGRLDRAREVLERARSIARDMQNAALVADVLEELSLLADRRGQAETALAHYRSAVRIRDSLRALVTPRFLREAGMLYGQQKQDQVRQDYEHSRSQDFIIFVLIVAILLGIVSLIALSLLRLKARANRSLESKNEEIREMNLQLSDLNHELARSEEKYRLLFERLPVGVFLYDSDMRLLQFNEAFIEILGSSREKLEGLDLHLIRDRRILPSLQAALQGEVGSYEGEYVVSTSEKEVDVAIRAAPLEYGPDVAPYGLGFMLDITNWKRIERELIESKELAEQADSLKHAFLTNISHEIRTPLNIIMGYFGLLQTDLRDRLTAEETDHFTKVDLAVRRLLRTVDQILNLSILEAGTYSISKEECVLYDLAFEVVEELRPLAREKDLQLELRPGNADLRTTIDRYSVAQSLRNILDNAVKFTDSGDITVSVREQENQVALVVEDSGIGMTDQYIQRLYQSFSQEEGGYTRPYDGLGLGLTLTKRYIEVNGGTVSVKSRKGVGTTFTLSLPLLDHAGEEQVAAEPPGESNADDHRPVLLVVEDDHETQKFLRLILHASCSLKFAESAEEAWEILASERFDLILMDISLRGEEDGLQLTRRIRQHSRVPDIPIIAVTAHAFADDRRRSLEAGCSEYLPKPFRVKQLQELVARFVQRPS